VRRIDAAGGALAAGSALAACTAFLFAAPVLTPFVPGSGLVGLDHVEVRGWLAAPLALLALFFVVRALLARERAPAPVMGSLVALALLGWGGLAALRYAQRAQALVDVELALRASGAPLVLVDGWTGAPAASPLVRQLVDPTGQHELIAARFQAPPDDQPFCELVVGAFAAGLLVPSHLEPAAPFEARWPSAGEKCRVRGVVKHADSGVQLDVEAGVIPCSNGPGSSLWVLVRREPARADDALDPARFIRCFEDAAPPR
jgi:hypothetical protein